MSVQGCARSSIYLYLSPDPKSKIIEALRPGDPLEVQEDAGAMFKALSTRLWPPVPGYVLKSAVVVGKRPLEVFPKISLPSGGQIDSVPPSLLAIEFEAWLQSEGEPTWLFEDEPAPFPAGDQIRVAFQPYRDTWARWFADVVGNNRTKAATMHEWFTILNGGRNVWSFRTERIFQNPTDHSAGLGWVTPKDILLWTGRVYFAEKEPRYKYWYEVNLTKMDKEIKGWYKASLLEEFILPETYVDPYDPDGVGSVFDLSQPVLRIPVDPEIAEAEQAGRNAYQYINIKNATGWNKINKNLCGEFCVAALGGSDVVPFLKNWSMANARAKTILEKDYGTVIYDLQMMLNIFNRKSEIFRPEPSIAPATPAYLEKMLKSGKKAIIGVGVSRDGRVTYHGRIRHWVVLEDVIRMGNSGWVRLYNPFFNRDEVYPHHTIFDLGYSTSLGLWVDDQTGPG